MQVKSVTSKSSDGSVVDAIITTDSGDLTLTGLNLNADAIYPKAVAAWIAAGNTPIPFPAPASIADLIGQFTAADATAIRTALGNNATAWLQWHAALAQPEQMVVKGPKFQQIWTALTGVLGASRMSAIATALNISP